MKRSGKTTALDFALLGMLHGAPQSGYDLRKVFAETALGNYSSSPGAIYPALKRLEKNGLVEGKEDHTVSLRPKRLYHPTRSGKAAMREWLLARIDPDDVRRRMDELLLRFAFHSILNDPGATYQFLSHLDEHLENYLEELSGQRSLLDEAQALNPDIPPHGRLALEFGISQYQAWRDWARESQKYFEKPTP